MASRPPSPPFGKGYFSVPFERFLTSAFTLLDTVETYFDSHVDLLQRKLQKHSDRLKMKAEETFKIKDLKIKDLKIKDLSGDLLAENLEREIKSFKLKLSTRVTSLSASWQSAKVVRTREKVSFFFGVMTLLFTALMFGMAPQWIHIAYTAIGLYLLPLRFYQYKKRAWHYFLFDLCYYVTILNFIFIWFFPSSRALSAVITWRNSLVFHDQDKAFLSQSEQRFPALSAVSELDPWRAMFLSGAIYAIWQFLYWKFLLVDRRAKIQSGQRTTSFSFLLNDKRSAIGRMLSAVPEQYREAYFMGGQFVYALLTEIPPIFLLYRSSFWSAAFLFLIFSVSVWNGGGFYIEVFGRKFERELEALRKEIAENSMRSSSASGARGSSHADLQSLNDNIQTRIVRVAGAGARLDEATTALPESKKDS
ncbi:hypothetical protein BDZ97DRAFT_1774940 [Flammula alnicola]|nr:hypothetical protein BDZ97DRAFT_1774940 [Flammula alnicola]